MELKSVDTANSPMAINTTGAIALLNGISRGDDINEREGRKVIVTQIQMRATAQATAATGTPHTCRFLIVTDRQCNGTALTIANVLDSVSTASHYNLANRERFKILADNVFTIGASADYWGRKAVVLKIPGLSIPVTFGSGNAGTVADIMTNSIYILGMGSNAVGGTAGELYLKVRIRYYDA